ncbi:MAG TPA: hypothetical protein VNU26_18475 [Mycobacteriales bacterium]|nr:hypothetical protein [Mycobacteriales bacterium]
MSSTRLRCLDCGRDWSRPRTSRRYTRVGLLLRRTARRSGSRASWAHPRPDNRCPSCFSRRIADGLPSLQVDVVDLTAGVQPAIHDQRR